MPDFLERLRSGRPILMDGAMGTQLQERGARLGADCLEAWNLTRPQDIAAVHRAYVDAGAECLLTNTFQANPQALARQGMQERLGDIWRAALTQARSAQPAFVLADVGPLAQIDGYTLSCLVEASAGADGVLFETLGSAAAWLACADLFRLAHAWHDAPPPPLLASFAFERVGGELQTHAGETPEVCAERASAGDAAALGANCGIEIDVDDMLEIVVRFRSATHLPVFVRPNAGTPQRAGESCRYPRGPATMAPAVPALVGAGVAMIGGCCGTTPAHIAAFRAALASDAS